MRRRRVSLATPSSHERRRQLMNDYQNKSRQSVKMSLNKCGFELLVANLTFCIMSKMVRVHIPWPRRLQAFPEFSALCMAWIAAQARSGKFQSHLFIPFTPSLRHKRSLNVCAATYWTILYCFYSRYFGRSLAPKSRSFPSFSNVAIIS